MLLVRPAKCTGPASGYCHRHRFLSPLVLGTSHSCCQRTRLTHSGTVGLSCIVWERGRLSLTALHYRCQSTATERAAVAILHRCDEDPGGTSIARIVPILCNKRAQLAEVGCAMRSVLTSFAAATIGQR